MYMEKNGGFLPHETFKNSNSGSGSAWIQHSFYPGFAFTKTARSRSAKNECGTTDLILANSFLKTEPKIERERELEGDFPHVSGD